MPSHVSIQGFQGSFHEVAARRFFGAQPVLLPCATFGAVVAHVVNGTAGAGLMAMENSLAGSILPNYLLLERHAVRVTGEVYLPIHQHLLALPFFGGPGEQKRGTDITQQHHADKPGIDRPTAS